jgi:RimJ/RimL family protein N-acetyltransferase
MSLDSQSSSALNDGVVLTTPRMVLRAVGEADISQLYQKIFSVPEVMNWVFAGAVLSLAESESFIRANFNFKAAPTGLCVLADKAQLAFGFEQLERSRLLALASAQNAASIGTLQKLGMHYHSDVAPSGRTAPGLLHWRR